MRSERNVLGSVAFVALGALVASGCPRAEHAPAGAPAVASVASVAGADSAPIVVVDAPPAARTAEAGLGREHLDTPSSVTARAETPFAARIAWEARSAPGAGFEVQMKAAGDFVRVALVDPTERTFVHHQRLPRESLEYRVRAFDASGASPPSPVASVTMPAATSPPKPLPIGPCIPRPKKAPPSSGCNPDIDTIDEGNGHVVLNVPGAGDGCQRHLVGEYRGCTRELGVFWLQADVTVAKGHETEGWPLLHAIAGAGQYVGATIQTLQFSAGRYHLVDEAHICGDTDPNANAKDGRVDEDLRLCRPPFPRCQEQRR